MNTLEELGRKYGTDKGTKHHYLPVYFDLFENKRNSVRKVVEVGAGEGAGLRMFRDFFPRAWIYGVEIDPDRVFTEDRIKVFLCDQSSKGDLLGLIKKIGNNIDLFTDDGSHIPKDQIFTCQTIMPLLKEGAIYIIEDVADEGIVRWLDEYKPEMIRVGKRYDDRLIIIKK